LCFGPTLFTRDCVGGEAYRRHALPVSGCLVILRWVSTPPPPRRSGVPLGERPVFHGSESARALPAPSVRHVWVRAPGSQTGAAVWVAGVLLRWESGSAGVMGQVAFVVEEGGSPVMVTQLLPASLIRAAASEAPAI